MNIVQTFQLSQDAQINLVENNGLYNLTNADGTELFNHWYEKITDTQAEGKPITLQALDDGIWYNLNITDHTTSFSHYDNEDQLSSQISKVYWHGAYNLFSNGHPLLPEWHQSIMCLRLQPDYIIFYLDIHNSTEITHDTTCYLIKDGVILPYTDFYRIEVDKHGRDFLKAFRKSDDRCVLIRNGKTLWDCDQLEFTDILALKRTSFDGSNFNFIAHLGGHKYAFCNSEYLDYPKEWHAQVKSGAIPVLASGELLDPQSEDEKFLVCKLDMGAYMLVCRTKDLRVAVDRCDSYEIHNELAVYHNDDKQPRTGIVFTNGLKIELNDTFQYLICGKNAIYTDHWDTLTDEQINTLAEEILVDNSESFYISEFLDFVGPNVLLRDKEMGFNIIGYGLPLNPDTWFEKAQIVGSHILLCNNGKIKWMNEELRVGTGWFGVIRLSPHCSIKYADGHYKKVITGSAVKGKKYSLDPDGSDGYLIGSGEYIEVERPYGHFFFKICFGNELELISMDAYEPDIKLPSAVFYNWNEYSVRYIGTDAFRYNGSLRTITLPDTIVEIKEGALESCYGLQIIYPE